MVRPRCILDVHQHVFWHGRDDSALVADMDGRGIDRAVLLSWDVPPGQGPPGLEECANPARAVPGGPHPGLPLADAVLAARRYPDRFLLGYCPDPADGSDAIDRLDAAVRMYDVRLCGEWKFRILLDDPRCLELFRFCGRCGLGVLVHLDVPYLAAKRRGAPPVYQPQWYGGTVENLARALKACPQTIFLGHGPGFWREISGDADRDPDLYPTGPVRRGGRLTRLLEEHENLWVDLSANSCLTALRRNKAGARRLLNTYRDRVVFGRDNCTGELLEFLMSLRLSRDVSERVFRANAERLLHLSA